MGHRRPIVAFVALTVPLYVAGSFASQALAPYWQERGHRSEMPPAQPPIVVSFVGDMMWDRYVRERASQNGYDNVLKDVTPLFASSTYVIGNLEGPITSFAPVSSYRDSGPNHYRFTFATTVAETLARAGFSAVTLANNHMLNFGHEGIQETIAWLATHAIGHTGAPHDPYVPWRTTYGDRDLVLVAYDAWNAHDASRVSNLILAEPRDSIVLVFAHWGEEYDETPNETERALAHSFVDAGADLVVGSHPHVIQSKELYKGVWIYYSLGNFVFDQYFEERVRCGLVLTATFHATSTHIDESFVELSKDGTTRRSTCAHSVHQMWL